jgi:2-desacetyl-2-hydroxyethyl bacteriochlorophyllide A dehydrogenase
VRLRTQWTQVSIGTEVSTIDDARSKGQEAWLGYSNVGVVEALGAGVTDVSEGQRILSAQPHASAVNVPTGPANLVPVPERLGPDVATLGVLGSVAYHVVERASPRLLEPTAVIGQGVVGSIILQLALACGARPVIAIDADGKRLNRASELGATHAVDASKENVAERVREITNGQGVSLCIEAANSPTAYPLGISLLALRGRFVVSSFVTQPVQFVIDTDIVRRELSIIGAHQPKSPREPNPYYPWTQSMNRLATMEMIRDGRLKVDHLISHRIKPADATAVYERLVQRDRSFVGVLIDWT